MNHLENLVINRHLEKKILKFQTTVTVNKASIKWETNNLFTNVLQI